MPKPPENISAVLATRSTVRVSWDPRPSAEGIVGYSVYRDGLRIGEATTTSYVDTDPPELKTHTYAVASHSKSGVVSELSATASVFAPDASPPRVIATTPRSDATNVSLSPTVQVTFSEPVDVTTLSASSFNVKTNPDGLLVPGTLSYAANARTAIWTASTTLPRETGLTAIVTTAVKDTAGNALASDFALSFTTLEAVPPRIIGFTPADGSSNVPTAERPTISFSERAAFPFPSGSVRLENLTTGLPVQSIPIFDSVTHVTTITPTSFSVIPFNTYRVTVDGRVTDIAGNLLANPTSFTFTFGEYILPKVVAVAPADGATNVVLRPKITATFERPRVPVIGGEFSMQLRPAGGDPPPENFGSWIFYTSTAEYFTTITPLQPNTDYTVTVMEAWTDPSGTRREETYSWSFRTGP